MLNRSKGQMNSINGQQFISYYSFILISSRKSNNSLTNGIIIFGTEGSGRVGGLKSTGRHLSERME